MTEGSTSSGVQERRHVVRPILLGLAGLALVLVAAWLLRIPIAGAALGQWCQSKQLTCSARIEALGLTDVRASNIEVRSGDTMPLAMDTFRASIAWEGLFSPRPTALEADGVQLRARFDGETWSFGGLESLAGEGGGAGETAGGLGALPRIELTSGELQVETPAGAFRALVDSTLTDAANASARFRLPPASLANEAGRLAWSEGGLDVSLSDGRLDAAADLRLDAFVLGEQFDIRDGALTLEVTGAEGGPSDVQLDVRTGPALAWDRRISAGEIGASLALAPLSELSLDALLQAVEASAFEASLDGLRADGMTVRRLEVSGDLKREAMALAGPVAMSGAGTSLHGLTADAVDYAGDVRLAGPDDLATQGALTLTGAALNPAGRAWLAERLTFPDPWRAHGGALASAAAAAMQRFDLGLAFEADYHGETWQVESRRATSLSAVTGAIVSFEPYGNGPWLAVDPKGVSLSGQVSLSGGGLPDLGALLDEFSIAGDEVSLKARNLRLARWSVGASSLAARLDELAYSTGGAGRASGQGEITLDGRLATLQLRPTRLFGAIDAAKGGEGWRVQTRGRRCLGLQSEGFRAAGIGFGRFATSLCPEDGRLLAQMDGRPGGRIALTDTVLPWQSGTARGEVSLSGIGLHWRGGTGLSGDLALGALGFEVRRDEGTARLSSGPVDLAFELGGRATDWQAAFRAVELGGDLVPARVRAPQMDLAGRFGDGDVSAHGRARDVRITHPDEDPAFEPLLASLSLDLGQGALTLEGPVRLAASDLTLANATGALDLATLSGEARLASGPVRFSPAGLQPRHISDRLRGFFTDASGTLEADARLALEAGEISGTASLAAQDFSFQTLSVSRVEGVTGRVEIDDLIALTSPPGQEVTIAHIDPGVPLADGIVRFELLGGPRARLESAIWPFAGGQLSVEPAIWSLASTRQELVVAAEAIELGDLIDILRVPELDAEGTVSGRFPIRFEAGGAYIENARFAADAKGGRLRYTGAIGEQAGAANETAALAFRALRDFNYTVLAVRLDGNLTGRIALGIDLEGHNPDVLSGTPFRFNITVDSELAQLIASGIRLTQPDWLGDVVVSAEPGGE